MKNYKSLAKKFYQSHFFVAGYGCFDVKQEEFSKLLKIMMESKKVSKELEEWYDKLSKQRMG